MIESIVKTLGGLWSKKQLNRYTENVISDVEGKYIMSCIISAWVIHISCYLRDQPTKNFLTRPTKFSGLLWNIERSIFFFIDK